MRRKQVNLTSEFLIALNAAGWGLAFWLAKRQFSEMTAKIEALSEKFSSVVTRPECQGIHNRLHVRADELDSKIDNHGERLARVEVAAGK